MDKNQALKEISKCKSIDEVIKLAKENKQEITKEKATELFNKTHSNDKLSDEELSNVSGGAACSSDQWVDNPNKYDTAYFDSASEVKYLFKVGDEVKIFDPQTLTGNCGYMYKGTVSRTEARTSHVNGNIKYVDCYRVHFEKHGSWYDDTFYRFNLLK